MRLFYYIHALTGRIFKILPLKEKTDAGKAVFLDAYLDGLWNDMRGAFGTFPELEQMPGYLTVCNKVYFLKSEPFDMAVCRREVLGALRILNCMERELGGEEVV